MQQRALEITHIIDKTSSHHRHAILIISNVRFAHVLQRSINILKLLRCFKSTRVCMCLLIQGHMKSQRDTANFRRVWSVLEQQQTRDKGHPRVLDSHR